MNLQDYADLEGSEIGEAAQYLVDCLNKDYCYSDEFQKALKEEAANMLAMFKRDTNVITETKTFENTYTTLEWK